MKVRREYELRADIAAAECLPQLFHEGCKEPRPSGDVDLVGGPADGLPEKAHVASLASKLQTACQAPHG